MSASVDPHELAERAAAAMYERDRVAQGMNMTIEGVGPGFARLSMTVSEGMLNGHDIVHGGMVFTLADTAFAYACNARNERTVALAATISFSASAKAGEVLTAVAQERTKGGRTSVYDVTVTDRAGATIALFRGNAYRVSGEVIGG